MGIAVIIPAYDAAHEIGSCLAALAASTIEPEEIVVVDDGSADATGAVAAAAGSRVVRLSANRGPAAARNLGVRETRGDVLMFVDADVAVAPDALARMARVLEAEPEIAAVFGSYDTRPRAPGTVSQYRNLLHHYVHQHASPEAFTFWAGCGAVRRAAFDAVGGFDEGPAWRSIEDIELGYRLRRAGYRIRLDKEIQGTHLKRWTLGAMVRTDVLGRAAPWTRLIRRSRAGAPADLTLTGSQRISVAFVGLAALCVPLALAWPMLAAVAAALLMAVVGLNVALYRFMYRERGLAFALACVPLHALYFVCGGAGYVYGALTPRADGMRRSHG